MMRPKRCSDDQARSSTTAAGKSLAELAQAKGVSPRWLIKAILDEHKADLAKLVSMEDDPGASRRNGGAGAGAG